MTQWHLHSRRKYTGGKNNAIFASKKKLMQKGSEPTLTVMGESEEKKLDHVVGGNAKIRLKKTSKMFVSDPKANKTFEAEIETVKVNDANRLFPRRNILTKGAVVKLKGDKGYAVITSRPGQSGIVQGKLTEFTEKLKEKAVKQETAKELHEKPARKEKEELPEKPVKEKKEGKKAKMHKEKETKHK